MRPVVRWRIVLGTVFVVGLVCSVASCRGSAGGGGRADDSPANEVSTINGEVPVGAPSASLSSVIVLRRDTGEGTELVISRTTRAKGTRAPIHLHDAGGSSCVEVGQVTLFMEGEPPQVARQGECYDMPAGVPMSAYASGDVDAVMLDVFEVPAGDDVWQVLEPGHAGLQEEFASH